MSLVRTFKNKSYFQVNWINVEKYWISIWYVEGVSSVALSFSANFDKLLNNSMSEAFEEYFPLSDGGTFAPYVDFFAFGAILFCSGIYNCLKQAQINDLVN